MTELSFVRERTASLRSLSGWRSHFRIPSGVSGATQHFVAGLAEEELKQDLDKNFDALRTAFRFSRRELQPSAPDDGTGTITTPHFNYSVTVSLNPDEASEVLWRRTVDAIRAPDRIGSPAFAQVFDGVFDTLMFSLPSQVNLEEFIDAVDAMQLPDVKLDYDREVTYCDLRIEGAAEKVTLRPDMLSIVHYRPQKIRQLLESFDTLRKLVQKYQVPLIAFVAPAKERGVPKD
jgi:hypothetical protein